MDDGQFVLISSSSCHEILSAAPVPTWSRPDGTDRRKVSLDEVLELSGDVIETILTAEPRGCCEEEMEVVCCGGP